MNKIFLIVLCALFSCSSSQEGPAKSFQKAIDKLSVNEVNEQYLEICARLDSSRKALALELKGATTKEAKSKIYDRARALIIETMSDSMFVCWYGTEWDFNGITTTPREGEIACGYFVTTLVRDAGFKINRVSLAQCASQSMIYTLCPDDDIKIITGGQVAKVKEHILSKEDGIFLIGLDTHTGFVVKKGTDLRVVHSNYTMASDGVMSEPFDGATVINYNNYFVIGDFLSSDSTIIKWLNQTEYKSE
jgi:hypothetical protein